MRLLLCSFFLSLQVVLLAQQGPYAPLYARKGMVSSSHYLASEVGNSILQQGGNAVDAAVATAFALAVTLPSAGNIGGGGFLVYMGADGEATSFDFREKAPLKATKDLFLDEQGKLREGSNHKGGLSIGVPGTVAGLYLAHQRQGKLPWKKLLQPAIQLAQKGVPASWRDQPFREWLLEQGDEYASTAEVFLKKDGTAYAPNENWQQPDLAQTLRRIQKKGAAGFYEGKTAELLVDYVQKQGGIITLEDLKGYQAVERTPVRGTYRGYEVIAMPPPSSGGVALIEMLNILEGYELAEIGHNSALYLHLLTEAMRRAFADRALHLGDMDFNPNLPLAKLTSKSYSDSLRRFISFHKASPSDSSRFSQLYLRPESPETTHFSVVDEEGNAVSMTFTLERSYGCKLLVKGAGFLLNNEMGDFNPVPGLTTSTGLIGTKPNLVEPGKRMLSSMCPVIVAKEGKPYMAIGSPGGRTIINTVLQVILNVVDHDMNMAQAIAAPRIHHQWLPNYTRLEDFGFSKDTQIRYEAYGHNWRWYERQGRAMGIRMDREKQRLEGASDPRSYDGAVVGE